MGEKLFTIVELLDHGRYWCIGTNVLVNPPLGKRVVSDMTYIDLIVKREWAIVCVCYIAVA